MNGRSDGCSQPDEPSQTDSSERLSIMVVDPDPIVRQAIARQVAALGHDVSIFSNCNQAWEVLQAVRFDAVLVNLETPAITALELARRVSSLTPSTELIATSANIDSRSRLGSDLCRQNGFSNVVSKAVAQRTFQRSLQLALAALGRSARPADGSGSRLTAVTTPLGTEGSAS